MHDQIQKQILDAFFVVLRPIAKILLRYGIGYREFAEVAKSAFVDVATSEYGLRGRPTNASRVAVMTGLTRKEVRRLREQTSTDQHNLVVKTTPLATILHKWHSDEEFLDRDGRPADLAFSGLAPTFSDLVRKYGGDIPPGAMRTELKRINAVVDGPDEKLRVTKRQVYPKTGHEYLTMALMHSAYALLSTIAHNTDSTKSGANWAQLTAYVSDISRKNVQRLRRISLDRLSEVAESFDDLFIGYENGDESTESSENKSDVVAVGLYYFEEQDSKMKSVWES